MESTVHHRQRQVEGIQENLSSIAQERNRVLSIIKRAEEITSNPDLSCMVQDFLALLIDFTRADSGFCFQLDSTADELILTHVQGGSESQHLIGMRLNRLQGLPGKTLKENKISVIRDLPADLVWVLTDEPENDARKMKVVNLPITNHDHAIGVVQLFNFKQVETDMLSFLSSRLAVELERRKEIDSIQHANERLLTLMNMLGDVAGTLDRNQLLHLVAEDAARLVNAERSSLFLVNPTTSEMLFQVAYQTPEQKEPVAAAEDRSARSAKLGPITFKKQGQINQNSKLREDEFSYFNRSTITMPLRSDRQSQVNNKDRTHILGGLMVLNKRNEVFQEQDAQLIKILADQASTFLQVAEVYENTGELFLGVIKAMVAAIDAKDAYTQGHSQRVSDYSVMIARELKLDETLVTDIRIGSLLHDIGKIGIPDSILSKPGSLTEAELHTMQSHPHLGVSILSQVKAFDQMQPAIIEHHERLDGSGYPNRLIGKQISMMGRIVAVADVFDAMTSDRPYRQAISYQKVLSFLNEKADILFDASCINALNNILNTTDSEN